MPRSRRSSVRGREAASLANQPGPSGSVFPRTALRDHRRFFEVTNTASIDPLFPGARRRPGNRLTRGDIVPRADMPGRPRVHAACGRDPTRASRIMPGDTEVAWASAMHGSDPDVPLPLMSAAHVPASQTARSGHGARQGEIHVKTVSMGSRRPSEYPAYVRAVFEHSEFGRSRYPHSLHRSG